MEQTNNSSSSCDQNNIFFQILTFFDKLEMFYFLGIIAIGFVGNTLQFILFTFGKLR